VAYYRGSADRQDRAKAVAAVLLVHAALAAAILSGLDVRVVRGAVERMTTIEVREPPPPPPPEPPPPTPEPQRAKLEEGAAGKKSEPTPVVAPKPRLPVESPIPAAPVAGTGSAPSAGAADRGTGTGAGGSGSGRGGGGAGDYSGFTPARVIRRIPDREYRRISAGRIAQGSASIGFRVTPDGRVSNCRTVRSSGDPLVDSIVCEAATRHMRFSPARDAAGNAISQDITYTVPWYPNPRTRFRVR